MTNWIYFYWSIPRILAFGRWKQEGLEFTLQHGISEASLTQMNQKEGRGREEEREGSDWHYHWSMMHTYNLGTLQVNQNTQATH